MIFKEGVVSISAKPHAKPKQAYVQEAQFHDMPARWEKHWQYYSFASGWLTQWF